MLVKRPFQRLEAIVNVQQTEVIAKKASKYYRNFAQTFRRSPVAGKGSAAPQPTILGNQRTTKNEISTQPASAVRSIVQQSKRSSAQENSPIGSTTLKRGVTSRTNIILSYNNSEKHSVGLQMDERSFNITPVQEV